MTEPYGVGTVSVANGGTVVTGTSTFWVGKVRKNDLFTVPAQGIFARITADPTENDELAINGWPGTDLVDAEYEIISTYIAVDTASRTRELLLGLSLIDPNYDVQVDVLSDRDAYDNKPGPTPTERGFAVLVSDIGDGRSAIYSKVSNASADWSDAAYFSGPTGGKGWSPQLVADSDGERRVLKLAGYVGGDGTEPTDNVGEYLKADGTWTATIGDAVDFRGEGFSFAPGGYDGGTAYAKNDVVRDAGSSWILTAETSTGHAPPTLPTTSNAYWELLAQKGADGAGTVASIAPGVGILVDNTDPTAPEVSVLPHAVPVTDWHSISTDGDYCSTNAATDANGPPILGWFVGSFTSFSTGYGVLSVRDAVGGTSADTRSWSAYRNSAGVWSAWSRDRRSETEIAAFTDMFRGFEYSMNATNPTTHIDVGAGICRDSTNQHTINLPSAITKSLDANWAAGTNQGGLDTGSKAVAFYHIHAIYNPTTDVRDVLFSLSMFSPTMPSGFTSRRWIGAFLNGNPIVPFVNEGDWHYYKDRIESVASILNNSTPTLRTLSAPPGAKAEVEYFVQANDNAGTSAGFVTVRDPDRGPYTPAGDTATFFYTIGGFAITVSRVFTDTLSRVLTSDTTATGRIVLSTEGWRIDRRVYL